VCLRVEEMINCAIEKAREVYRKYPFMKFPLDIEKITADEGCEIVTWPFVYPVREVKRGRYIGIATGLPPKERRYLVAHALAHHLLHCGNQLAFHGLQTVILHKQEREADECAAHILVPEEDLAKLGLAPLWEIADYFGIPEELARRRINDFGTETELLRWKSLSLEER
jgi:Zn-dependent peptidase ImmA (M78 family)